MQRCYRVAARRIVSDGNHGIDSTVLTPAVPSRRRDLKADSGVFVLPLLDILDDISRLVTVANYKGAYPAAWWWPPAVGTLPSTIASDKTELMLNEGWPSARHQVVPGIIHDCPLGVANREGIDSREELTISSNNRAAPTSPAARQHSPKGPNATYFSVSVCERGV